MTGKEAVDREHFFQLSSCEYNLKGRSMKLSKQRASLDVHKFPFSQREEPVKEDVVDAPSVNQFKNRLDKFWQRYGHEKPWLCQTITGQVQVQRIAYQ